jgi:hypothetical protein
MPRIGIVAALCVGGLVTAGPARAADKPLVEEYLHTGKFRAGEKTLTDVLKKSPRDDQARFGLGVLQFLRAVEGLGQSLYRHGVRSDHAAARLAIPVLRLPVPKNPKPEKLTYAGSRRILVDWIAALEKAEKTLAAVRDDKVKLPLRLGLIRMDLDGDGKADDPFDDILKRYLGGQTPWQDRTLLVKFDRGDVAWLRGYCHLLTALAEVVLAYDGKELFDHTAHLFFANAETPYQFLNEKHDPERGGKDYTEIIDLITVVHLIRMPLKEPARLKSALGHLRQMLTLSKEMWKYILAETGDDHEWIPNPKQTGVMKVPVTQAMVDGWLEFVTEAEALLAGKKLVPFWRGKVGRGVNLRRCFTEPRRFDLVLWVQGTAAAAYLEKGTLTTPAVWARLQRVFGGEFIGFALWFN